MITVCNCWNVSIELIRILPNQLIAHMAEMASVDGRQAGKQRNVDRWLQGRSAGPAFPFLVGAAAGPLLASSRLAVPLPLPAKHRKAHQTPNAPSHLPCRRGSMEALLSFLFRLSLLSVLTEIHIPSEAIVT